MAMATGTKVRRADLVQHDFDGEENAADGRVEGGGDPRRRRRRRSA